MLEMMKKLKAKRAQADGGRAAAANKLLHAATATANKARKGRASKSEVRKPRGVSARDDNVKNGGGAARKKSRSRSASPKKRRAAPKIIELDSTLDTSVEVSESEPEMLTPPKRGRAKEAAKGARSVPSGRKRHPAGSRQLSSNSSTQSTHSTKENKNKRSNLASVPARRSPRAQHL